MQSIHQRAITTNWYAQTYTLSHSVTHTSSNKIWKPAHTVSTFSHARDGLGPSCPIPVAHAHVCSFSSQIPVRSAVTLSPIVGFVWQTVVSVCERLCEWLCGGPKFLLFDRLCSLTAWHKKSPPLVLWHLYHLATCGWSSMLLQLYHKAHVIVMEGLSFVMGIVGKEKEEKK